MAPQQGMPGQNPMAGGQPPAPGMSAQQGMPKPTGPLPGPRQNENQYSPQRAALEQALQKINLAEDLDEQERMDCAQAAKNGYDLDKMSRKDWETQYDDWMKLALQVVEPKNFPWVGAANIKFPILSIASMQFAARAYPTLIPSDRQVVKQRVIGADPQGMKAKKAECVGKYMSWQVMDDMVNWEEEMDRMMTTLPIIGCAFKKTWFDDQRDEFRSEMVPAKDLVVNYWAKDLETCERKTQEYFYTKRQLMELINGGYFLDLDCCKDGQEWPDPVQNADRLEDPYQKTRAPNTGGPDTPYLVIEQHTFYDIDGDGYPEPVVITVLHQTGDLLRVSARYASDGIKTNEKGKLVRIEPLEFYTKFPFFPNPDGGFYDIGFGALLGPINEAVNTILNQLVDAGTLNNLQGGWMSKGLRMKNGDQRFIPGEWKQVNATLEDLRKGILPHQYKEPSNVLYQLLGMLVGISKELSSVSEIMVGKMPGQNTPAYTTKESVEQGQKVFTAIYKRVFRALAKEFRKLYRLNSIYTKDDEINRILDEQDNNYFSGDPDDIIPAADPSAVSAATKSAKGQQLMQLIQLGAVNKKAALTRILELEEIPLTPELMAPPEPDPKQQAVQQAAKAEQQKQQFEMQMMQQEHQLKMQEMQMELQMKQQELEIERQKAQIMLQIEQAKLQIEMQKAGMKLQSEQAKTQVSLQKSQLDMQMGQAEHAMNMEQSQQEHTMGLEHGQAQHQAKMKMAKEAQNAKPQQGGRAGVAGQSSNKGAKGKA